MQTYDVYLSGYQQFYDLLTANIQKHKGIQYKNVSGEIMLLISRSKVQVLSATPIVYFRAIFKFPKPILKKETIEQIYGYYTYSEI